MRRPTVRLLLVSLLIGAVACGDTDADPVGSAFPAVLGVRELTHDHAAEQPFTRSLSGVEIPPGIDTVTVEGRDLVNGWGGATVEVRVDR